MRVLAPLGLKIPLILFFFTFQVLADSHAVSTDQDYFRSATEFFNNGEYDKARTDFEKSLKLSSQEQSRSVLYYNLGSVCYKLKDFEASQYYFEKLLNDEKLGAVAFYNLALIKNQQNDKQAAIENLEKSKLRTNDAQLQALINRQLATLKGNQANHMASNGRSKYKDWHAYIYLSPGYDSNINFAPLEVGSDQSGKFVQGVGWFDKVISGDVSNKKDSFLLFTSSVFLSNYFSTDFNDYNIYDFGLRYRFRLNKWHNTFDMNLKQSSYGHSDYQRIYAVTARTKRRVTDRDTVSLRYRYEQINSLNTLYDYLEGNRHRIRATYRINRVDDSLLLLYELEINNRRNTLRRNYSPTRDAFRLRYEKVLAAQQRVFLETEYRRSDYEPTSFQDRLDNRTAYSIGYIYDFPDDWQLRAQWRFQKNRSNDSIFTYDRHVGLLTIRKSF